MVFLIEVRPLWFLLGIAFLLIRGKLGLIVVKRPFYENNFLMAEVYLPREELG